MNSSNLAAQLYTVRDFLKNEEDIDKSLRKVRDIGYKSVQVSGMGPINPNKLKDILDKYNLTLCVTHTPWNDIKNEPEKVINNHKLWDCRYVGLGAMPEDVRFDKEKLISFAQEFDETSKIYEQNGLKLLYHNHKFEFQKFDGKTGFELLLENFDRNRAGLTLDVYWVHAGGANPSDFIKKAAGHIVCVHLKDMEIIKDAQVFSEVGSGNLNWDDILAACRAANVEWYAVEQDLCRMDPFESLEVSYKFLEKYL